MHHKFTLASILLMLILSSGCSVSTQSMGTETAAPVIVTSTLPPAPTPLPSETPPPPPPTPTTAPVEGTSSTQINVRAEPSTAGSVLGVLPANAKVQITGSDPGGNWWQILHPAGVDGKGWVAAKYITTVEKPDVPVIGGGGANPQNGNVAIILQKLNVRSGPGTGFDSIGTLNAQDVVSLTGKDAGGAWLQIEFAAGAGNRGWVNAVFVQAKGVENLSIITEAGLMVGTETPTGIPLTPTATLLPAPQDGDSAQNPAVYVQLSGTGTRSFQYSGDVSSPNGDMEDWVGFSAKDTSVFISLTCRGNGSIRTEWFENGSPLNVEVQCGGPTKRVAVRSDAVYSVHLEAMSASGMRYAQYTITIGISP